MDVAVYDNVGRQLLRLSEDSNQLDGQKVEEYALVGNTLFTLHKVVLPGQ